MNSTLKKTDNNESYVLELLKLLSPYKWSILFITLISILLAIFYLYFATATYESYAILKVKIQEKDINDEDLLRKSLNMTNTIDVKQEIAILKTYKMNKEPLEKINFKVRYFTKKNYKTLEFYNNVPISISDIDMSQVDSKLKGIKIILKPKKNGFTLSAKKLGESKLFPFNQKIKTPYFTGIVKKNRDFNEDIIFYINGTTRQIYEGVVKNNLNIQQLDKKTNLIRVAFQDNIAQRAHDYVNALIENYIQESIKTKKETNTKILHFLDTQLKATRLKLEKSEAELEKYKSQNTIDPSIKSQDTFERLSTIDLSLSELQLKEKLLKNLSKLIRHSRDLSAIGPTLLEFNDQTTLRLLEKLQTLQEKEDELKIEYTDRYPELIKIRKSIRQIRKKIFLNIKNLKSTIVSKKSNLVKQKKSFEVTLKSLPKKEKKLVSLKRDYEVNANMYTYLLKQKYENELIKVAAVSDYEVIDSAYTPTKPVRPKRLVVLIIATFLGLIFGIILALLRSLFVDKITSTKDIELLTELPIYGLIPTLKSSKVNNTILKEAYQKLAANIQFYKKEDEGNIVLVSSHAEKEGKTTVIASLAGVFQQTDYRSILVDFNLKKPAIHTYFGLRHDEKGVSSYLSNRDSLREVIYTTKYPNLDIITSGPTSPNLTELVLSPRLEELFNSLKEEYDYILVDTSAYADELAPLYLMKYADTNLILLTEGSSKKSTIQDLKRIIREKNLKNIGLVIIGSIKNSKAQLKKLLPNKKPIQLSI